MIIEIQDNRKMKIYRHIIRIKSKIFEFNMNTQLAVNV